MTSGVIKVEGLMLFQLVPVFQPGDTIGSTAAHVSSVDSPVKS